jgi:hypothetical protein
MDCYVRGQDQEVRVPAVASGWYPKIFDLRVDDRQSYRAIAGVLNQDPCSLAASGAGTIMDVDHARRSSAATRTTSRDPHYDVTVCAGGGIGGIRSSGAARLR